LITEAKFKQGPLVLTELEDIKPPASFDWRSKDGVNYLSWNKN